MNISFVYPGFLTALLLLAIPIIIHLFNFRKFKRVLFTNVRFLNELKQETTSQSRLKHLLVLLARLLAVALLVIAFSQPYIPAAEGTKLAAERVVSIYIDNSFSMEAVTREGTLVEIAKQTAREIASAYKPSDRFHILTNDFNPVQQRLISRDEFITAIDEIRTGPVTRNIREVLLRQADVLGTSNAESKNAIVISDFQESAISLDEFNNDTSINVSFIPVNADRVSNIIIDSCWFSTPLVQLGELAELNVRIRNMGSMDDLAVPVKLMINDIQKAVAEAKIPEMGYADIKLTFTASNSGWQNGVISIIDDPIIFDDKYYFSFYVAQEANILSINDESVSPYLSALFNNEGYFVLNNSEERKLDYSNFSNNNVIYLNELNTISSGLTSELNKYMQQGGVVVMFPDSGIDIDSYNSFFTATGSPPLTGYVNNNEQVNKLLLEDEVFTGVFSGSSRITDNTDLPSVKGYYMQSGSGKKAPEVLMSLRSGAPFLSRYRIGKGELYFLASPLSRDISNFSRHALFVPVMYRITLLSEKSGQLAYYIGEDDQIEIPPVALSGDMVFHLTNEELNFDIIPAHRTSVSGIVLSFNNTILEAGNYRLTLANDLKSAPAFNYNRAESVMSFLDTEALTKLLSSLRFNNFTVVDVNDVDVSSNFTFISEGTPLWKYCIILVLLFLAFEIALLKFWKK